MVVRGFTRITRKGQITVPAEIRLAAGLAEGDRIEVLYDETTGKVTIESPAAVVERTYGLLKPRVTLSVEDEKRLSRATRAEYLAKKHSPES